MLSFPAVDRETAGALDARGALSPGAVCSVTGDRAGGAPGPGRAGPGGREGGREGENGGKSLQVFWSQTCSSRRFLRGFQSSAQTCVENVVRFGCSRILTDEKMLTPT